MNMTKHLHLVRQAGKYQFNTLVRCDSPRGGRTEHRITVFCDDKEEARAAARDVAERCGYTNCSVDKIVNHGNWQH